MKSNSTLLILFILFFSAFANEESKSSFYLSTGYTFQQWSTTTISESELRQSTVPLHFYAEFSPKIDLALDMSYAHTLKVEEEDELSGINNVSLLLTGTPIANRLQLMGGISIPSGKSELTLDEVSIAEMLSDENLYFRTNHYGGGTEGLLGVAFASALNENVEVGLATSLTARAPYQQTEESSDEYNPGEFIILNGGLSISHNKMLWGLDLTGRISGEEELAEKPVFKMGPMFISELYYKLQKSRGTLDLSLYTFSIGNSSRLSGDELTEEILNSQGLRFGGMSSFHFEISPHFSTTVIADMDGQNSNDYATNHLLYEGKKLIAGGGLLFVISPTEPLTFTIGGTYHKGSIGEGFALSGGEEIQGLDLTFDMGLEF